MSRRARPPRLRTDTAALHCRIFHTAALRKYRPDAHATVDADNVHALHAHYYRDLLAVGQGEMIIDDPECLDDDANLENGSKPQQHKVKPEIDDRSEFHS